MRESGLVHGKGLGAFGRRGIGARTALALAAGLVLLRLALTGLQLLLITPNGAPLDDTLMYTTAVNITQGQWLGEYGWLTLSKYMLFPLYLALVHTLGVPYLLAGQLLYTAAAAAGGASLWPLVRSRRARLAVFAALLWNPAACAAQVTLRIYRDNITPVLALALFAGFIGFALRRAQPLRRTWPWLLCAAAGLTGMVLNREDGVWVLAFALPAALLTAVFLFCEKDVRRLRKTLALAAPFAVLAASALALCAMNQAHYGRFILSDFSSGEFADAYGALTRVESAEPQEKVPVPRDVRERLYSLVPELAAIEPYLETDMMYNSYGSVPEKEFYGGGFYWALREAASDAGYYESAETARAYFAAVAEKVNALCDDGTLPAASGRRSGTTPPVRAQDVLPTLAEGFVNMGRALTFAEAEPAWWDTMSEQLSMEPQLREEYEAWLKSGCNWMAQEGTNRPYYSPVRQIAYKLLELVRFAYMLALPLAFAAALFWQARSARRVWQNSGDALCWLAALGLLLCMLLRCMMIAFMFVTSFNDVPRIMYLAAVHPMAILYACIGCAMLAAARRKGGGA